MSRQPVGFLPGNDPVGIVAALPTEGVVTSEFGMRRHPFSRKRMEFHKGIDVASHHGTAVRSIVDGRVLRVGRERGYGLIIEITHGEGWSSVYAHLSRASVSAGEYVTTGTVIGAMGRSGAATGCHLHYELRRYGVAIDPRPYFDAVTRLYADVTF